MSANLYVLCIFEQPINRYALGLYDATAIWPWPDASPTDE